MPWPSARWRASPLECCLLAGGVWRGRLVAVAAAGTAWTTTCGTVGRNTLAVALAALLASSSLVVDQSMAASLSSGNVSVLTYGNKIVALVLAIVAVSLSTVLVSALVADDPGGGLGRARSHDPTTTARAC